MSDRTPHMERRDFLRRSAGAGIAFCAASLATSSLTRAEEKESPHFPIGCYTRPWQKFEYRVALDEIAEAGYRYVGLMTQTRGDDRLIISVDTPIEEAQRVGEEVRRRGLTVKSVWGGGFGSHRSKETGIAGLRHLVDCCEAVGSDSLLLGGVGSQEQYKPYYDCVSAVCDYAMERGVAFALKPHGGTNSTGPECRDAIEYVGHKNMVLWYDPGNIYHYSFGEIDPVEDVVSVAPLVRGMCVKDFEMTGEGDERKRNVALTPGEGRVDFQELFERLFKGEFDSGPLIVECLTPGDLPFLRKEAARTRKFLESMVASSAK